MGQLIKCIGKIEVYDIHTFSHLKFTGDSVDMIQELAKALEAMLCAVEEGILTHKTDIVFSQYLLKDFDQV